MCTRNVNFKSKYGSDITHSNYLQYSDGETAQRTEYYLPERQVVTYIYIYYWLARFWMLWTPLLEWINLHLRTAIRTNMNTWIGLLSFMKAKLFTYTGCFSYAAFIDKCSFFSIFATCSQGNQWTDHNECYGRTLFYKGTVRKTT